jgi:hypothetical protein
MMVKDAETKSWGRTGEYITAVDKNSALLQLPDSLEAKIPVDADHSHIVKFDSKNNQSYSSTVRILREFERDAIKVVSERFCTCFKELCFLRLTVAL